MDFGYLKDFMDRLCAWRIPGNTVSVILRGKEVFRYSAGFSDAENGEKMHDGLLFNIYSCSKIATVTAALQLYEKGAFLLNDPVSEYLPEFADMTVRTADGIRPCPEPMRIRHLFTMTSGLNYDLDTEAIRRVKEETGGRCDTRSVIRAIASAPLDFVPGEKWQYSLSHDVLAALVEAVSGRRFSRYMEENVFAPLGIGSAAYHNENVRDKMAKQYRYVAPGTEDLVRSQAEGNKNEGKIVDAGKNNSFALGPDYDSGGAGITVKVPDYALFCAALSRGGLGLNGERILSPGTVELLRTDQLLPHQRPYFNWPQLCGYGYGLGVRTPADRAASGTNGSMSEFGWGGAAGATAIIDTENELAVFYAHHMLNPQEEYYQPRLRNVVYASLGR